MKKGVLRKDPVRRSFGGSKDRFFVLERKGIVYFEKEGAPVPKGTFELTRWSSTSSDGESLTVNTGQFRLVLRGDDLRAWQKAIDDVIDTLGGDQQQQRRVRRHPGAPPERGRRDGDERLRRRSSAGGGHQRQRGRQGKGW